MKRANEPSEDEPQSKRPNDTRTRIRLLERIPFRYYWQSKSNEFRTNANFLRSQTVIDPAERETAVKEYADEFIDSILEWVHINTGEKFTRGPAYNELRDILVNPNLPNMDHYPEFIESIYNSMLDVQDQDEQPHMEGSQLFRAHSYLIDRGFAWFDDRVDVKPQDFGYNPDHRRDMDKAAERMKYVIPVIQVDDNPNYVPIKNLASTITRQEAMKAYTMYGHDEDQERYTVHEDLYEKE